MDLSKPGKKRRVCSSWHKVDVFSDITVHHESSDETSILHSPIRRRRRAWSVRA